MNIVANLIIAIIGLTVIGLGAFFYTIYQVTRDIENINMYPGGDIIGIGDDMINPDTSTTEKKTTNK
jgi:hypothetical protein